jgi:hypothetical protein
MKGRAPRIQDPRKIRQQFQRRLNKYLVTLALTGALFLTYMVAIYYITLLALTFIYAHLDLQAHGVVEFSQNMDSLLATCKLARNHICMPIKVDQVNSIPDNNRIEQLAGLNKQKSVLNSFINHNILS